MQEIDQETDEANGRSQTNPATLGSGMFNRF